MERGGKRGKEEDEIKEAMGRDGGGGEWREEVSENEERRRWSRDAKYGTGDNNEGKRRKGRRWRRK